MNTTSTFLPVVGTTFLDLVVWKLHNKLGKIILNFQDQAELTFAGAIKNGQAYEFKVYESTNGTSWTLISGVSAIALAEGGQQVATVQSNKTLLKITGRVTTAGGGKVRLDVSVNGKPFFGQADLGIIGKSGFGTDFGVGLGSAPLGAAEGTWPE